MKGLGEYLKKYGRHFTEELAKDVIYVKWDMAQINKALNRKVYYNVTSSTSGDILYLINYMGNICGGNKTKSIDWALYCVGTYCMKEIAFNTWFSSLRNNFDFRPYTNKGKLHSLPLPN